MQLLNEEQKMQFLGSIFILVIVGIFVVGLPIVANSLPDPNQLEAGKRFDFRNGISIIPTDGWSLDPDSNPDFLTILTKAGVQMMFVQYESDATLEEKTESLVTLLENDATKDWTLDKPIYFETNSGLQASTLTAHTQNSVSDNWIVKKVNTIVAIVAESSDISWKALHQEMDEMVMTIEVETSATE